MKEKMRQFAATRKRGDTVNVVRLTGHRVPMSTFVRTGSGGDRATESVDRAVASSSRICPVSAANDRTMSGFTLIELVITLTVLAILTLGVVPLVKVAVKRQKEQQLREALRMMRSAIDEFHRDTMGMNCSSGTTTVQGAAPSIDPRSRVMISDCTIFGVDNLDRYPPDLDTLKNGVNVIPRLPPTGGAGLGPNAGTGSNLPTLSQSSTKTKVYLREIPIDPMTGKAEWDLRSCYDTADAGSWGGENVFDVRSKSKDKALNGEKYNDW
jgi:general secretion pathway protein G